MMYVFLSKLHNISIAFNARSVKNIVESVPTLTNVRVRMDSRLA